MVGLRVAAATSMGDISISAALLNSTAPALPDGEMGFFCATSLAEEVDGTGFPVATQQCVSMPVGTVGSLTKSACEASCLRPSSRNDTTAVFFCARCAHVYDRERDGGGVAFEDLPDSWQCPLCGAPKASYALVLDSDGRAQWAHHEAGSETSTGPTNFPVLH